MEDTISVRNTTNTFRWRSDPVGVGYALGAICGLVAVSLIVSVAHVVWPTVTQSTPPPAPVYTAGSCFVTNGTRESWELPADGKVLIVGEQKYLWETFEQYDRNKDKKPWRRGREVGMTSEFRDLESYTHRVDCPREGE